jgi:predicted amidohydrolase
MVQLTSLLVARAIENQSFVVGVNRTGPDGNGVIYSGNSMGGGPTGHILRNLVSESGNGGYRRYARA